MKSSNRIGIKILNITFSITMAISACACGRSNVPDYSSWINRNSDVLEEGTNPHFVKKTTDYTYADNEYTKGQLTEALLDSKGDNLAEMLWQNQIASGVYTVTEDEIEQNSLTYYVSSSEGDDDNFGLSPDSPKKTLQKLSGLSNITVLLKCGDTFDMTSSFVAGSNCIYGTYGKGKRPVVSFYQDLNLEFSRARGYENVWQADLSEIPNIYTGQYNKDNCNIGQLVIDGETNWKRIVVSSSIAESGEYDFAQDVENKGDGCWNVDWLESMLYIHSEKNPSNYSVQVAPDLHGIVFENTSNTKLQGWTIVGAGAHGINLTTSKNIAISCCYLKNIGGSVHRSAGIRYGNGIQIWNGGEQISITNNYADWIFDSCYTDQGTAKDAIFDGICFANNIGSHSFTGIESWGDGYEEGKYENVVYRENVLFAMCDITNIDHPMYAAETGGLVVEPDNREEGYKSFRGGYTYNQMACLNAIVYYGDKKLKICDNVFWNTNRFLLLANRKINNSSSNITGNLFHGEVSTEQACLYRYKDTDETMCYVKNLYGESNTETMVVKGQDENNQEDLETLSNAVFRISNLKFDIK